MTNWQDIFAIFLVAIAAVVVARRAYRALFRGAKAGCSTGCSSCPSTSTTKTPALNLLAIGPSPTPSDRATDSPRS